MTCEYKENKKKKSCDFYIKSGFCSKKTIFRCVEYIERNEPTLSHSGIINFIRCPKMYYYAQICGIQKKETSDPIKIGSAVDSYITEYLLTGAKNEDYLDINADIDNMWQAKAIAIMKAFRDLIGVDKYKEKYVGQHKFVLNNDGQPQIQGFLDLHAKNDSGFIELKTGRDPAYYINLFYIKYKLATYFMSNDKYKTGTVWAIRVPDLKRTGKFKNESYPDYSNRCHRDMLARAKFYFPGYNPEKRNFGAKFGRAEIDVDEMVRYYRMIADNIKGCIDKDLWIQNGTGCLHPFECNYLSICKNNGAISEDVYGYREKK
jgi:hypothetical protein